MRRVTNTQVRMLEFIERWFERRGRAPSVREISRGLGLKSSSSVQYHLRAMERQGVLVRGGRRGCGIRIVRRLVHLTNPVQELNGQLERQMVEAMRQLVNAVLPLQSREHLTRAELHYIRRAVELGIAVIQKLDVVDAEEMSSRDGAPWRGLGCVLSRCDVLLWDYLVEILAFGPQGWFLVTDEPAPAVRAAFHELPDYFAELGRDGWELVSMTAVSSTDRVVVVFKRPVHE